MSSRKKACATCTLAKTKCIWKAGSRCERCLRLNKVCAEQMDSEVLAQKSKSRAHKAVKSTHVGNPDLTPLGNSMISPAPSSDRFVSFEKPKISLSPSSRHDVWLAFFRTRMSQRFPFVIVSPSISASDLEADKPLLFNAIMMAACDEPIEQVARAIKMREDLARALLVEGKRSIDALQAILIACSWYHVHVDVSFQLSNYLAIGIAMLYDLRLASTTAREDRRKTRLVPSGNPVFEDVITERSLEERRIFLGFAYLSTFIFVAFRRLEVIRNISYLDECCQILELSKQYPTDTYLIFLAGLAKRAQIMSLSLDIEDQLHSFLPSERDWDILHSLETDLKVFWASQNNNILTSLHARGHMQLIELYLYELACLLNESSINVTPASSLANDPRVKCRELANNLLSLSLSFLDGPPSNYAYIESWFAYHPLIVMLKTTDPNASSDLEGESVERLIRRLELKLFESSQKYASAFSGEHNIYRRVGRQVRTLRERFAAQRSVDAALKSHELSTTTSDTDGLDQGYDINSWLGDLTVPENADLQACYELDMSGFDRFEGIFGDQYNTF